MPEITDDLPTDPPTLDDVIRTYVINTCVACGFNLNKAACVLKVSVKTLYNYMHRYAEQGYVERGPRDIGWRVKVKQPSGAS